MRLSAPIHQLKRRARLMARNEKIALHEALDRIARLEGFDGWSLLASRLSAVPASNPILPLLKDGDLLLVGARPGHGKTLLGLRLLLDAARQGRKAVFFTLEYTESEARNRIRSQEAGESGLGNRVEIVTSDEISADFVVNHLSDAPRGSVAVIDYLQILDQRRSKPALSDQLQVLRQFARRSGVTLGFISQIDRSFDPAQAPVPGVQDLRLPNPIEIGVFSKACFLHDGEVRFQDLA
jgi:replicative DNA helicase